MTDSVGFVHLANCTVEVCAAHQEAAVSAGFMPGPSPTCPVPPSGSPQCIVCDVVSREGAAPFLRALKQVIDERDASRIGALLAGGARLSGAPGGFFVVEDACTCPAPLFSLASGARIHREDCPAFTVEVPK